MSSLSRPGFFMRGFTRACLSPGGTYPEDSDRLIIAAMVGASGAMHFLKRRVGSGSSSHELAGETLTSRITSSGTSEVKSCSTVPSDEAVKSRRAVGVVGAPIETRHAKRRRQRAAVLKDAQEDERRKDWYRDDGMEGGPDSGCSPTAESRVVRILDTLVA